MQQTRVYLGRERSQLAIIVRGHLNHVTKHSRMYLKLKLKSVGYCVAMTLNSVDLQLLDLCHLV
jgi:Cft2 family RNA processing exonuclease